MSSAERRGSRPDFLPFDIVGAVGAVAAVGAAFAFGGRPGPLRATPSVLSSSSCKEAPRIAARTDEAKAEVRSLRLLRSVDMIGDKSAPIMVLSSSSLGEARPDPESTSPGAPVPRCPGAPVPWRRIDMRLAHDSRLRSTSAFDRSIEVIHLKPQKPALDRVLASQ